MNKIIGNINELNDIDSESISNSDITLNDNPKIKLINSIFKMQENSNEKNCFDSSTYKDNKVNTEIKRELELSGSVTNADLRGFDPEFSKSLNCAIKDAKKDFPDLKINYCGTIQNQVQGIKQTISTDYENELRELNGDRYSDELYKQIANDYAEDIIKQYGLNETNGVFAWSLNMPSENYKEYNGIAINECYASNNDTFNQYKIQEVQSKHKPVGCDTSRATVDHELGHEIDKLVNARNDDYIKELYNDMVKNGNARDNLSAYSETSVKEFIAEAYAEYRNNPVPRDYSLKVYERLIYLYSQRGN